MRYVKGKLENNRPIIRVGICRFDPGTPGDGSFATANTKFVEYPALIDTGARRTCITEAVVQDLRLQRRGRVKLWNIKREEDHWTFLVNIGIWPTTEGDDAAQAFFGLRDGFEVIDVGNHPYFQVLIGMDLLERGHLEIKPNGQFSLGFAT